MIVKAPWLAAVATALAAMSTSPTIAQETPDAAVPALDPGIRKMIEAALAGGDETTIRSVLAVARKAAPEARDEIDRQEQSWQAQIAAQAAAQATQTAQTGTERTAKLQAASLLDNWKGEIEVGASRVTGNTSSSGLVGSIELKRKGVEWTHRLSARADVQSTNDTTTTERVIAAWQPGYRFRKTLYAYGLVQYEHDPFAGYDNRYTLGGGLGWNALDSGGLKLELEGGPALRWVDETDIGPRSRLAGRGSLNLKWRVTPTLSLTQRTAVYIEGSDGNVVADTALDTKLIGNLKARFSYNLQYERNPPAGAAPLNTQSRATFVYSF